MCKFDYFYNLELEHFILDIINNNNNTITVIVLNSFQNHICMCDGIKLVNIVYRDHVFSILYYCSGFFSFIYILLG